MMTDAPLAPATETAALLLVIATMGVVRQHATMAKRAAATSSALLAIVPMACAATKPAVVTARRAQRPTPEELMEPARRLRKAKIQKTNASWPAMVWELVRRTMAVFAWQPPNVPRAIAVRTCAAISRVRHRANRALVSTPEKRMASAHSCFLDFPIQKDCVLPGQPAM